MAGQVNEEFHQTFLTLLGEIQDALKTKELLVMDEFVIMIVKLVSLDPPNKFLIKQQMVASELDRMKKLVVDRILSMSPLAIATISLQLHVRLNYFHRGEAIDAHREDQELRLKGLMDELKAGTPKNLNHYDLWYAKLIGASILEADLGSASEETVVTEAEAALVSVFPKDDINLLTSMSVRDREAELYHLMHIAIGIRLYSKHKNPEEVGAFIQNLPQIIPSEIEDAAKAADGARDENIQRLIRYTTVAQNYFLRHLVFRMGRRAVDSEMVKVRQALVLVHQVLIYLKQLSDDLFHEKQTCSLLNSTYENALTDLENLVVKGSNEEEEDVEIPRTVLYPKFVELCDAWRDLQECHIFVDSLAKIVASIVTHTKEHLPAVDELVEKVLGPNAKVPTEKEFFKFPTNIKLPEDKYALAKRVDFREDLSPLQMSFSGFCIHSFVKGIGLLLLSNPNLGVFNWKNQNYLMSSAKSAVEFRRDPESFVGRAYAIARKYPELIALLNIEKEAFDVGTISEADRSGKTTNVMISSDADTQTELHPVESNIVKHYTWNEWDLRRRGLILSKIHKCRTHGTQTHWQALKQNAEIQTYAQKTVSSQTDTNVSTELPLSQFYIYGLRGLHCEIPPHVVELVADNPTDLKVIAPTVIAPPIVLEDDVPFIPQIKYGSM